MRLLSSPKRKLGPRSKITRIMMLVIALFSVWCLGFGFFFVGKAGPSSTSSVPEPSKNTRQLRKSFDNSSVVRVLGKTKEEIADDLVMGGTPVRSRGPNVAVFTVSDLGTHASWKTPDSPHIKKKGSLLTSLWNSRILEGQGTFTMYTGERCHTRDTLDEKRDTVKGLRCCSVMFFSELFDKGYDVVVYVDESVLLGFDFTIKEFLPSLNAYRNGSQATKRPITVMQQRAESAVIIVEKSPHLWPDKSGYDEFIEMWMLDVHRQAHKHTMEESFLVASRRYGKLYKAFSPVYMEVGDDPNVLVFFQPNAGYDVVAGYAVAHLREKKVMLSMPKARPEDGERKYAFTDGEKIKRTRNVLQGKRLAFSYGNYDFKKHPWALPIFLWNRLVLWKSDKVDLRMYTGSCMRKQSSLLVVRSSKQSTGLSNTIDPHWCRVWVFDDLFTNGYSTVLYIDADLVLRAFFSISGFLREARRFPEQTLFKTRKDEMPGRLLDRDVMYTAGKSENGEVEANTGLLLFSRPSRKIFTLWKENYGGGIWDQLGLKKVMEKFPMTYRISPYRSLWNHYSSTFKDTRDARILRGLFELATGDVGPVDRPESPLIVRRTQTLILPIGHHAGPWTQAVFGKNGVNSHRKVFARLRHPELDDREKHVWKLKDITFMPLPDEKGGGADVGVGQRGT
jgi:hypothetical protein